MVSIFTFPYNYSTGSALAAISLSPCVPYSSWANLHIVTPADREKYDYSPQLKIKH